MLFLKTIWKKGAMKYFRIVIVLFLLNGVISVKMCSADEKAVRDEIAALKTRITALETKLHKKKPEMHTDSHLLHRKEGYQLVGGLQVGAGATFIIQGAVDTNNADILIGSDTAKSITDASYSIDLEIEKGFGDYGLGFVHLETGDGAGVEDELEVFSNVNRDTDDSDNNIALTEAWYEHYLFDNQLSLRAGKVDATVQVDQSEIAHCECTQFLGRIFRNAPTIDFPDNTAGIRGLFAPAQASWVEFEAQILDGDNDWEDIGDHIFTTYQTNIKPGFFNRDGNYRIYGWYKDTKYTDWTDTSKTNEDRYGFGLSIDQQLTDIFTVFGRYGWADPDVYDPDATSSSGANYSLEQTWSIGGQLDGESWGREDDHLGVAIGMVVPSDEYKKAGSNLTADDEGHFELYYLWQVNKHLALSPDLQIIWNPFGSDYVVNNARRNDTITVIGCRGQVDF